MTSTFQNGIYFGTVVHKRLRPIRHALSYKVFAMFLDCGELCAVSDRLRLFSYNKHNVFSLFDRDHGDGSPLKPYLAEIAEQSGLGRTASRFFMLCYPRIFGYVFNPITVYFGTDDDLKLRMMIYEVNNTFGQRKTYVLEVDDNDGVVTTHSCRKQLYVSPFNSDTGQYRFAVTPPQDRLTVGIALTTELGPTMKAHFSAKRAELSDATLLKAIGQTGWVTAKVSLGIHYNALKLWLKGLRIRPRPRAPIDPISNHAKSKEEPI